MSSVHLGIDLGATNTKWVVVDRSVDDWTAIDRGQVPTRAAEGADAVIARLIELARSACTAHARIASIGVGVPGLYDPVTGTTRFLTNMPGGWRGQPLAAPLAAALGMQVGLINDARAFGLAELRLGAGRGARTMVGFTLGTGVGGVVAVDGQVHDGHDGTAGELGHQTIDPDGPWCSCGSRGCLEAYVRADQVALACGAESAEAAVAAARAGDALALAGIERAGRYLGIGIANTIVMLTPDRVVLGGGMSAAGDLLLDPVRRELEARVHVTALDEVELRVAELGTWAGAIGAAIRGAERAAALATGGVAPMDPAAAIGR